MKPRQLEPEWLDAMPSDHPEARRSRADLKRINAWMGHVGIMTRKFQTARSCLAPTSILEIGAGDGLFTLELARRCHRFWPGVKIIALDRQPCLSPGTIEIMSALGWPVTALAMDIRNWQPGPESHDLIVANLFLHHLDFDDLETLFQKAALSSRCFIALEPRRMRWPKIGATLLALLGCNRVTRHDGLASIKAGFYGDELTNLWPKDNQWRLEERRGGLFSHLFFAIKKPAAP